MGLIRKTLSVGTLGIVSFRGKKERLRRAERSRRDAETALDQEHAARVTAETRIAAAEKRVKQASLEAADALKRLEQSRKRGRRIRTSERAADLLASAAPIVRAEMD